MTYNAKDYWEKRFSKNFNLSAVGFGGFSEFYNKWLYKAKLRVINKALQSQGYDIHGKTVCDVGCGTGFWVDFYSRQGAKSIVGLDITSISINNLKIKYPEYNFIEGDITSPSFESKIQEKYDIVNVFDVLYHIVDDTLFNQAIVNILNLVKKDGIIFMSDSCAMKSLRPVSHYKARDISVYEEIFNKNSINTILVFPMYYLLNRPIFAKWAGTWLEKIGYLDNLLAPGYYMLDGVLLSSKRKNLDLIMVRKNND